MGIAILLLQTSGVQAQSNGQLELIASDANHVILELVLTGYDTGTRNVNGTNYSVLSVPGLSRTGAAGKPQLPVKGTMIGIPPGAQPSLKILTDDSRRDTLPYPPIPVAQEQAPIDPRQTMPREPTVSIAPDSNTYSANQFYPAAAARIVSVGDWRSQHYATVEFDPLQYNPSGRQLLFHRRLRVEITFTYPQGKSPTTLGGTVNEGRFEAVLRNTLSNYDSAKNWRRPSTTTRAPGAKSQTVYPSSSPWYKIAVNSDGIYKITCTDLAGKGINLSTLDPSTLQIFKQETELAINVVGTNWGTCDSNTKYLEFFAQGIDTKYTDTNVYWLTYGATTGRRMALRDGGAQGYTHAPGFMATTHLEKNYMYRSYMPMVEDMDHWYWNYLAPVYGITDTLSDHGFQIPHLASLTVSPTLKTALAGYSAGLHHTQTFMNGHLIDESVWGGKGEHRTTITFNSSYLNPGANTIRVKELNDLDISDFVFVNNFDVSYPSAFAAISDTLRFTQTEAASWQYEVTGFTASSIETFDITDPFSVTLFVNTLITPTSPSYTLQFADAIAAPHEYLALTAAQRKSPLSITPDTPSSLHDVSNGADYIIIAYGDFLSSIQRLANYRAAQGLRVKVVDVQDVYDEFNDGVMDPQAIRDFLKYANDYWSSPAPFYVLLVGQGTFDPRGYCATSGVCKDITTPANSTLLPPYLRMVDPWMGQTASDNRLVSFNDGSGNTLPTMAIGRLPALSAADVDAMVTKILNYEQNPAAGNWRSKVAFVTDNAYDANGLADGAGNFWAFSDAVASNPQYIPFPFTADRIYFNPCTDTTAYPQCALPYARYATSGAVRNGIIAAINEGRLLVNYDGHAYIDYWANERLFTASDIGVLANGSRLPVILSMTCYDGYFIFPGLTSMAETSVRLAGRGALAAWAPAGQGIATGHDYLDQGFFDAVMQHRVVELGVAAVAGKTTLWTDSGGGSLDLIDTFNLFGDPASRLMPDWNGYQYLPFIKR